MVTRRVLVPFGTRPEVVKLAPVVAALAAAGHTVTAVDTGQHTDPVMSGDLQDTLGLPVDYRYAMPTGPQDRAGALHANAHHAVATFVPDLVLALGDTATVPAYALAARAAGVPFAHAEAGLRSFNDRSVEEVNRKVAAACAQLHFAPTGRAAEFLDAEGVPAGRVFVVGNPAIDTLVARGVTPVPVDRRAGVLLTAHRPTNVDDPARLTRLVTVARALADRVGPVTFPVHPRTAARLTAAGLDAALEHPGIVRTGPVGYDELLTALAGAQLAVTDSGGIQEEAAYLGVPVVVLRNSTPRWEGVEAGTTTLAGLADDDAAAAVLAAAAAHTTPAAQARAAALPCPYGDGHAGRRIAAVLTDPATDALLALTEPSFTGGQLPW